MTADDGATDLPAISAADDAFVRELLATLPPIPIPDDLAERLDSALRSAAQEADPAAGPASASADSSGAGTTVVALDDARARSQSRRTRVLQVAAAGVLVCAGVIGVVKIAGSNSVPSASTGAGGAVAAGPSVPTTLLTHSGHAYTDATLVSDVRSLVDHKSLPAGYGVNSGGTSGSPSSPGSEVPTPTGEVRSPTPSSSQLTDGGSTGGDTAVSSQAGLVACLAAVEVGAPSPVTQLAVDQGQYRGKAALVVVLPGSQHPATSYDVFVVGIACGQNDDAHLLTYQLGEAH
jgi:hypothetical protein